MKTTFYIGLLALDSTAAVDFFGLFRNICSVASDLPSSGGMIIRGAQATGKFSDLSKEAHLVSTGYT
jgi:hypothetical protein